MVKDPNVYVVMANSLNHRSYQLLSVFTVPSMSSRLSYLDIVSRFYAGSLVPRRFDMYFCSLRLTPNRLLGEASINQNPGFLRVLGPSKFLICRVYSYDLRGGVVFGEG